MSDRTVDDLRRAVWAQLRFIQKSCEDYDNGEEMEAVRLALAVSILIHDKGNSVSILEQLGIKSAILFWSSDHCADENFLGDAALVSVDCATLKFEPICYSAPRQLRGLVEFSQWWNEPVIKSPGEHLPAGAAEQPFHCKTLSRHDVIMSVRDKDMGGHYDKTLGNGKYALFARDGGIEYFINDSDGSRAVPQLIHATVRQIAHELAGSILTHLPNLPKPNEATFPAQEHFWNPIAPGLLEPFSLAEAKEV